MGKVWVSISQTFPIPWVLLYFPLIWETDGETHAFSKWWSIPQDGNLMGKKQPYYGESMSINFPDFPPYHGFCCIFLYCGKFMGKPMHFPYDDTGYFFSCANCVWIDQRRYMDEAVIFAMVDSVWVAIFRFQ